MRGIRQRSFPQLRPTNQSHAYPSQRTSPQTPVRRTATAPSETSGYSRPRFNIQLSLADSPHLLCNLPTHLRIAFWFDTTTSTLHKSFPMLVLQEAQEAQWVRYSCSTISPLPCLTFKSKLNGLGCVCRLSVYDYATQSSGDIHIEPRYVIIGGRRNIIACLVLLHGDIATPRNSGYEDVQRTLSDILSRAYPSAKSKSTKVLQVRILCQWLSKRRPTWLKPSGSVYLFGSR